MSRVLKVSQSNYRLQTASGGTITLDTGTATGTVVVTGNLDVKGTTTTVESSNTTIKDNILQLNYGQTGNGISSTLGYQAGIEIERGNYSAAQILFNEQITHYDNVGGDINGTFILKTADGALSGLQVETIGNDGSRDFVIDMHSGPHAVLIGNSPNYHTYVTQDNHIVSKRYLTGYVAATAGQAVVDRVYYPGTSASSDANSLIQAYNTDIQFKIKTGPTQVLRASISSSGLTVNNINVNGDTVTNIGSNNLILSANTNNVQIDSILNLDDQSSTPTSDTGTTKIYSSATAGPGKTGLYITNVNTSDELISKSRAVLFSILL